MWHSILHASDIIQGHQHWRTWCMDKFLQQSRTALTNPIESKCIHPNGWDHYLLAHLSRRLIGELIVYQWLRRLSLARPLSASIFKHLLLWNYWANWTHISHGDSLGWGNESLFKWSWSHDQDGRHAHIWLKPLKNRFLQNQKADDLGTWYVALGLWGLPSLFKWWS